MPPRPIYRDVLSGAIGFACGLVLQVIIFSAKFGGMERTVEVNTGRITVLEQAIGKQLPELLASDAAEHVTIKAIDDKLDAHIAHMFDVAKENREREREVRAMIDRVENSLRLMWGRSTVPFNGN